MGAMSGFRPGPGFGFFLLQTGSSPSPSPIPRLCFVSDAISKNLAPSTDPTTSRLRAPAATGAAASSSSLSAMEARGTDYDGREFTNAAEMWREELGDGSNKTQWYSEGVRFWEGVEASVDGVLGGYAHVNEPDIKCSEPFLRSLMAERFAGSGRDRHLVALDCGSGIGRITKNLLIKYFNEVDLLEPVSHYLEAARESLAPQNNTVAESHCASNFYCVPLQEFTPQVGRYDVIWIQWCIGHLADDDFVAFFKRAKVSLKPGGFFVLKENIARNGFVLDREDRTVTRSDLYFKELFAQCGLHLYKQKDQRGFPGVLFPVKMYALTPDVPKRVHKTRSRTKLNQPGIIR